MSSSNTYYVELLLVLFLSIFSFMIVFTTIQFRINAPFCLLQPDLNAYAEAKEAAGEEAFYANANTYVHGMHKDSPEALERLSKDIKDQEEKRQKYSRRRVHDDDSDIDYINERNMKFNQKLERFYGKYTKDIKDNLERGTAVWGVTLFSIRQGVFCFVECLSMYINGIFPIIIHINIHSNKLTEE